MIKRFDLGPVTDYALAKEHGYEGTKEQFIEQLLDTMRKVSMLEFKEEGTVSWKQN